MSVFHVLPVSASTDARATRALERLCAHVDAIRTRSVVREDFERVERELHEQFVEVEREVLGELLERLDVDVPSVELGGRRYHRVLRSTETYTTAVGTVTAGRTLYRCGGERAVVPMELRAGIVEGHWTPLAARQASCVVAQMTPSEGEALLRELGNMAPSKSSLDRLPKGLSARWEANREAFESTLREATVVPDEAVTVAVSLDGVMVPMKDAQRAKTRERSRAAGRRTKGPAGYREASCATLSFYDAEGERLDTLSLARMPEPNKATLKTMLSAELDTVLGRRPELQVVTVADGGARQLALPRCARPPSHRGGRLLPRRRAVEVRARCPLWRERCERARPVPQAASRPARGPRRGGEGDSRAGLSAQEVVRAERASARCCATSGATATACAMPTIRPGICPSAPASSRPPARRWSRNGSSARECAGATPADRPS